MHPSQARRPLPSLLRFGLLAVVLGLGACTEPSADNSETSSSGTGTSGGTVEYGFCFEPCSTSSDCSEPQLGSSASCINESCFPTVTCADINCPAGYACEIEDLGSGLELATCTEQCNGPADCGVMGDSYYGPDNFTCVDGECEFQGCDTTQDCLGSEVLGDGLDWSCDMLIDSKSCLAHCTTDADCADYPSQFNFRYCDPTAGVCLAAECIDGTDCPSNELCTSDQNSLVRPPAALLDARQLHAELASFPSP